MAAVAYAHPSPAHQLGKQARGVRLCDTCGAVETPGLQRFRMCGGCMITQYCSPDCQKRHWPSHKAICQHTTSMMTASKQQDASAEESMAKALRKFCSGHQNLLSWAVFQALQLRRVPGNIRQYALHVELSYRNHPDASRRMTVSSTRLIPLSYIASRDPLVAQDIKRREERCRANGGIGAAVILIQCGELSQVMPAECDAPSRIPWDTREDWANILERYVEAGRTDFKPITTTSRGVIYG
ncbi:hypothetical protein SCHPADRAFT_272433 [Schizopora paradoxa]|uniref:MYND-type domain-containing protein n=1 Tax=Schizopora paradoxa TaxID=27342 RepID=A0A0H2RUJ2_9AGAM|nr:hypothetical protein SCHPADRAFT_272433 [Schizopora paradoxa]